MKQKFLEAATWYQKKGYSVIPVRKNKKPYIKWERYQTEKANLDQIRSWWKEWPSANIGLVTGEVAGIDVVDCDSEKGRDALNEFLPDTNLMPISKTPKGWHYFFKHSPGLSNGVRLITDCDLRTNGGYVIAPPSINGEGKAYDWMPDLSIAKVKTPAMPKMLFDVLQSAAMPASALKREHINVSIPYKEHNNSNITCPTNPNKHNISFEQGNRDEALFHIANCLVKGGMDKTNILDCLYFLAQTAIRLFQKKKFWLKLNQQSNGLKTEIETSRQRSESG